MPENVDRQVDSIEIKSQEEMGCMELALKAHSHLRLSTVFMTPEQRKDIAHMIVMFSEEKHLGKIEAQLKSFVILDERHIKAILRCLLDDESRTELVKIMGVKGFM